MAWDCTLALGGIGLALQFWGFWKLARLTSRAFLDELPPRPSPLQGWAKRANTHTWAVMLTFLGMGLQFISLFC